MHIFTEGEFFMKLFYRNHSLWMMLAVCFTIAAFLSALVLSLYDLRSDNGWAIPSHHPFFIIRRILRLDSRMALTFLRQLIPGLSRAIAEDDPDLVLEIDGIDLFLNLLFDIRYQSPQEILRVQIPLLSSYQARRDYQVVTRPALATSNSAIIETPTAGAGLEVSSSPSPLLRSPTETNPDQRKKKQPRILLLHTHTSESYLPVSGVEHRFNGRGDIIKVGARLSMILSEKYGISTEHSDRIHDYYPFRDSYKRSEKTITEYLASNSSLEMILDLHRDATPGLDHRVNIKGRPAAKIIVVVGTNLLGLTHPNWEKNHQFAKELAETADRLYPGLVHGIIKSEARYNQHLHPRSIILEFGDHHTLLEEAYYAAELMAEVLATYFNSSSLQSYSL